MSIYGYFNNFDIGVGVYNPWGTGFDAALSHITDNAAYALDREAAATSGFSPASFGFGASYLYPHPADFAGTRFRRFANNVEGYLKWSGNAMASLGKPSAGFRVAEKMVPEPKGFGGITINAGTKKEEGGAEKRVEAAKTPTAEKEGEVQSLEETKMEWVKALAEGAGYTSKEAEAIVAAVAEGAKTRKEFEERGADLPAKTATQSDGATDENPNWYDEFGTWYLTKFGKMDATEAKKKVKEWGYGAPTKKEFVRLQPTPTHISSHKKDGKVLVAYPIDSKSGAKVQKELKGKTHLFHYGPGDKWYYERGKDDFAEYKVEKFNPLTHELVVTEKGATPLLADRDAVPYLQLLAEKVKSGVPAQEAAAKTAAVKNEADLRAENITAKLMEIPGMSAVYHKDDHKLTIAVVNKTNALEALKELDAQGRIFFKGWLQSLPHGLEAPPVKIFFGKPEQEIDRSQATYEGILRLVEASP